MKNVERLEVTHKLLDDGRLSDSQIATIVGRSKRWVRNIARKHPRHSSIEIIYAPPVKPNVIERPGRGKVKRPRLRSRVRKVRKTLSTAWEWLGIICMLALYIAGTVLRTRNKMQSFKNRLALP